MATVDVRCDADANGNSRSTMEPMQLISYDAEDGYSLARDMEQAKLIGDAFARSELDEVKRLYKTAMAESRQNMYSSYANSGVAFVISLLTLAPSDLENALTALNESLVAAQAKRKCKGWMEGFKGLFGLHDFSDYTDEQCHAEMITSEVEGLICVVTFLLNSSSISNLLRCILKGRSVINAHMMLLSILESKINWTNEISYKEFQSGALAINGMLELMISYLPNRMLKFVQFVGYPGNRENALELIRRSIEYKDGLRYPFVSAGVAGYNLYVQHFGLNEGDMKLAEDVILELRSRWCDSHFYSLFYAKYFQLQGKADEAVKYYTRAIDTPSNWTQLHAFCAWELCWSFAIKGDWMSAAKYAKNSVDQSCYGKSVYQHMYACFLHMEMIEANKPELNLPVIEAMSQVEPLRRRLAGKTVPQEKFAISRAANYLVNRESGSIPAFDLFYFYNFFILIKKRVDRMQKMLSLLDSRLTLINKDQEADSYANVQLSRGVILRLSGNLNDSIGCFEEIIHLSSSVTTDTHLPPLACLELAISHIELGDYLQAKKYIEAGWGYSSKFLCQLYVHVRLHSAQKYIDLRKKQLKRQQSNEK